MLHCGSLTSVANVLDPINDNQLHLSKVPALQQKSIWRDVGILLRVHVVIRTRTGFLGYSSRFRLCRRIS